MNFNIWRRCYDSAGKWIGGHYVAGTVALNADEALTLADRRLHTSIDYKCCAGPFGQLHKLLGISRTELGEKITWA